MFKRAAKFFFVLLLLVILGLIIFRNQILKFSFENFARKNLKVECRIENVDLWFDSLAIKGLKLSDNDFSADIKKVFIKFKFQKRFSAHISEFNLEDANLKVKSLEGVMRRIPKGKTVPAARPVYFKPVQVNLQNLSIDLKSKAFNLASNFSFIAEIGSDKIFVKDAGISNLKIFSQDFEVDNLTFKKFGKNKYVFRIPQVRVKEKKFSDFVIPLKIDINQLRFLKAKNPFFGPDGYVSAKIELRKYDNFCFSVNFQNVSFERIIDIFTPEDAAFKGLFDGALRGCVNAFQVEALEASFRNKGNGFINIKKESSLAFLKAYLDKPSYDALIDNFKNYEYNIGVVSAKNDAGALNLGLDFTSEAMGKRSIVIKFHDVLGGVK